MSTRQEVWAYEFKNELEMPVLAVGAAFNFHAGELAQAPPLMQRLGLEWFFRLLKEPKTFVATVFDFESLLLESCVFTTDRVAEV